MEGGERTAVGMEWRRRRRGGRIIGGGGIYRWDLGFLDSLFVGFGGERRRLVRGTDISKQQRLTFGASSTSDDYTIIGIYILT
jgi:hypothetical protein